MEGQICISHFPYNISYRTISHIGSTYIYLVLFDNIFWTIFLGNQGYWSPEGKYLSLMRQDKSRKFAIKEGSKVAAKMRV